MSFNFQFSSLHDFWAMSGHGPYVWAAFAITFGGLAVLVFTSRVRRNKIEKLIQAIQRRTEFVESEHESS